MWRRTYLALVLLRLYFALSPSYLHPDEHFQGPEVIAGHVFHFPSHLTWEFRDQHPVRSVFPLWITYGWPLTILKWTWEGLAHGSVPPSVVFYTLRLLMFALSFVLEDWALHELLPVPRQRRTAIMLVASSYVTWTWQAHTFSNSIETLIVLWSLVLVQRINEDQKGSQLIASVLLGFLGVLGTFNRITFPAFLVIPLLQLVPRFWQKPWSAAAVCASASFTLLFAIAFDTEWYNTPGLHQPLRIYNSLVICPWNNLLYNLNTKNLAEHGLHPVWQHAVVNLPQLLGPAFLLLFTNHRRSTPLYSALCGLVVLSCFRHQEARFLLPTVPLFLASVNLPQRGPRIWIAAWVGFNLVLGVLMGIYHQGGIVEAQLWLYQQDDIGHAFWWKTLSPPDYLLGGNVTALQTVDLMGMPKDDMLQRVLALPCESASSSVLVAPDSAVKIDYLKVDESLQAGLPFSLERLTTIRKHINLNDLDIGDDGVVDTWNRVVGRRGLSIWRVNRLCANT